MYGTTSTVFHKSCYYLSRGLQPARCSAQAEACGSARDL